MAGTDGGSGSSVSGGMNMGRERLQSKNDYSYLGEDSQTKPLEDLGNRLMDVYNQGNAQSNLLFGGPGYGGSFVPRGGGAPPPGGGAPPPGGGAPPPGTPPPGTPPPGNPPGGPYTDPPPGTPPPGGSGGPVVPGPGLPAVPKPSGVVGTTPNAKVGGTGALSDDELSQMQKVLPSARRLQNGKVTWDNRVPKSYGIQTPPQGWTGVDDGASDEDARFRYNFVMGDPARWGGAGPSGAPPPSGS